MTIKILNTSAELKSFPVSQSIFLSSNIELESSSFEENIILFRLQTENQLINLSEPYSYNIGYLKETFDRTELSFIVEKINEEFKITCTPKKLLNLDSNYCLYISNKLSSKFITVSKSNSKSKSDISVNIKDNFNLKSNYLLKVEETSIISSNKNIARLSLDGRIITTDVRSNNKVIADNLEITLEDSIYVKGEEFLITIDQKAQIEEDLQVFINTVNSKSITPIPNEEISTSVSNLDILNFYNNLNTSKPIQSEKSYPKYLSDNVFSIKLPEGFTINKTKDIKYSLTLAFNNYILEKLNLHDKSNKYLCTVYLDDFENEVIFEMTYSIDQSQTELVVFNLENLE